MHKAVAIVTAVLLLTGCEKPTAPEARDIARRAEQKFATGDLKGVAEMFWKLGMAGNFWGSARSRIHPLTIARDGIEEDVNGIVVEEIIVPHGGVGQPAVRRTLAGWPSDFGFALYAATEQFPGYLQRPVALYRAEPHTRSSRILVHHRDTLHSWIAQSGMVAIADPVIERRCEMIRDSLPIIPNETVQCEVGLYEVAVRSEMLRRPDHENRLTRSFSRRHQLVIQPQRLPGVRFTTMCPADPSAGEDELYDCWEPMFFWRDNSQYAAELGVDIGRMQRGHTHTPGTFRHATTTQNGQRVSGRSVRWTIHAPDGRLIEQGMKDTAGVVSPATRDFDQLFYLVQPNGFEQRIQLILAARYLDPSASPYEVRVLVWEHTDR